MKAEWLHVNEEVKVRDSFILSKPNVSVQDIHPVEEAKAVEETLSSKHVQLLSSTVHFPYITTCLCIDEWIGRTFTVLCV